MLLRYLYAMSHNHVYMVYSTGVTELGIRKFQAKIGLDNHPSLTLFRKKLGFMEVSIIHSSLSRFSITVFIGF